jgi:O-antigen ligase
MNPRPLVNVVLVALIVVCLIGSYYAWGWAVVALAAAIALTRPWLPADGLRQVGSH